MNTWQKHGLPQNCFLLPREVFELGLTRGTLLVYLYLAHRKYLKHDANKLNCAVIGKAVGMCAKTVRTHLRTLANSGFIQMEGEGKSFCYALCPIRDKAQKQCDTDLLVTHEGGLSA